MLLLPNFVKGMVAKSLARKLVGPLAGSIDQEGGPSPKVYVRGEYRGRQVEVFLSVTWGHVSVTVKGLPARDLYFHLRSKAGLKRLAPGRSRQYEELDFAKGTFVSKNEDDDRADPRQVLASLEPDLQQRLLSQVKGEKAWSYTADGLEYDRACTLFSGEAQVLEALDLACDVAEGFAAILARRR